MNPLLIAHRGDTINFPENTIEAFQSAFEKGADGIELDVQLNNKNQVIVVHNYLYDKTKPYPLLQDVIQKFGHLGILEIELKGFEIELVNQVVMLINKYQPPQYAITSSVLPILPYVRQSLPKATIGAILKPYLFENWMTEDYKQRLILGYLKLTGANVAHLNYHTDFSLNLIKALKNNNYLSHCHLFPKAQLADYYKMQQLNINRLTVDNINLLNRLKNEKNI